MNLAEKRILVTGGNGFLGKYVVEELLKLGCSSILLPRHEDCDFTSSSQADELFLSFFPQVVIHLAADVGGIGANQKHPGRFFYNNLSMGLNLIESARLYEVEKFVQVGTVCAYPKYAQVPFREEDIWNGYPEETNAPYGIAKKALFVMLEAYKQEYGLNSAVVVPVNLYGPGDNFDKDSSHVIPALIRKCVEACQQGRDHVECWGSGMASREFLHVRDAAQGVVRAACLMDDPTPINLGTGQEVTIRELAKLIAREVGFPGRIFWDNTKPDGQPRRRLDVSRAKELLGWKANIPFDVGLKETVEWFKRWGSDEKS